MFELLANSMSDDIYPKVFLFELKHSYSLFNWPKCSWLNTMKSNLLDVINEGGFVDITDLNFGNHDKQYLVNKFRLAVIEWDSHTAKTSSVLMMYKDIADEGKFYQTLNIKLGSKKALAPLRLLDLYKG